jgi:DNA-binding winged helix-turn-helix (wHTH) protein
MSASPARLYFPPFVLDLTTGILENGIQSIRLKPQTTAVLRYLIEHAGHVVRQEELLAALWPGTRVSTGVLKTLIWEIRQALGDQPQAPRFIETLPRRGYRFIGPLGEGRQAERSAPPPVSSTPSLLLAEEHRRLTGLVGRETELALLHERLRRALAGERQIVFVTGEAGIGKTALSRPFSSRLPNVPTSGLPGGNALSTMALTKRTCQCSTR